MASPLRRNPILLSLVTVLVVALVASAGDAASQSPPAPVQRIEISIQDKAFVLEKVVPIQVGQTIEVIVRNHDPVRHGFVSASLLGLFVSGEDDQIMTYGKGIEGFYVNPGKTLMIRFSTERPGSFPFHCDLHQRMKGDLSI